MVGKKATLQATRVIHARIKESLYFFANKLDDPSTNYASSLSGFKMD